MVNKSDGGKMIMGAKEKLEELKRRKAKIDEQIAALKSREAAQARKEDTRLKVLIGAAMLADMKIHPKTAELIKEVLQRGITEKHDRKFLQDKGWLQAEQTEGGQ